MVGFDVIVCGGGHAGVEAASAAARSGCRTLLLAINKDTIGSMSCNPAIGGVGKGHLVREIDVFGGVISQAADHAAIHYRMLNASKGRAVHGPRIQADRSLFRAFIQQHLASHGNLQIGEGEIVELVLEGKRLAGVRLQDGTSISANALILATGTFLGGQLFRGEERLDGGRVGESGAHRLARQLQDLGLPISRLKTGTPPRLDAKTIDWSPLTRQESDVDPWKMSAWTTARRRNPQLFCGITRTNQRTHDIIRAGLHRSPLRSGAIVGRGPRYCPSIEDKVDRFGDRDGHQIFAEPEGINNSVVYPNGISTSLPVDIQEAFVRSIEGFEQAAIVEPGYAVEYDHVDPRILSAQLAIEDFEGIYLAGQINGTTGYEEAAAQGLVAGLSAAALIKEKAPIVFDRATSYVGVLVDDLILQGVTEPYRMLTSRAEHRLYLRADNAEARLGSSAIGSGVLSVGQTLALQQRTEQRSICKAVVEKLKPTTVEEALCAEALAQFSELPNGKMILEEVIADIRYAPYVDRQNREARLLSQSEEAIDRSLDFAGVSGLSTEMVERLNASRPATISQASRIRRITPAAVTALFAASRAIRRQVA